MTLDELNERFGIPGVVRFDEGAGSLDRVTVATARSEAQVYLLGGHVTHWRPAGGEDVLWVSRESSFAVGRPILGTAPPGASLRPITERACGARLIPSRKPEDIARLLMDAFGQWQAGRLSAETDAAYVSRFRRDVLTGQLADVLNEAGIPWYAVHRHFLEFLNVGVDVFVAMAIGGVLIGGLCGGLAYPLVLWTVHGYRLARRKRRSA